MYGFTKSLMLSHTADEFEALHRRALAAELALNKQPGTHRRVSVQDVIRLAICRTYGVEYTKPKAKELAEWIDE